MATFPPLFRGDVERWAQDLTEYLTTESPIEQINDPRPILLAHRVAGRADTTAGVDGILLYDPAAGVPVYSKAGAWEPFGVQPADLATVATTGAYADLSGLPSLDFVPLGGGVMTGDLVIRSGVLNLIKNDANATASIIYLNRAGANYVFAPAGGNVTFGEDASTPWAVISEPAVALGVNHVVTRSKGDGRYLQLSGGTITGDLDIAATAGVELTKSLKVNRDNVGGSQHIEVVCDGTANYIMGKSAEGNAKPLLIRSDEGGLQLRTIDASSILIYTGNVLRVQITPDGHVIAEHDVRVGTTSTAPGNGNTATGIRLNPDGVVFSSRNGSNAMFLNRNTSNGDLAVFNREGIKEGSISITTTATSYNTTSDERLKTNFAEAGDAGALLDMVDVLAFDRIENGEHIPFGFVAQQLHELIPEAVQEGGEDPATDPWQVDNSKLVPYLVKEIKSLRRRIEELEHA